MFTNCLREKLASNFPGNEDTIGILEKKYLDKMTAIKSIFYI